VVSQIDRHLIGAAVETEDGRRVGILKDLLLTEYDWRIMQLVVSEKDGDRLLTRDVIVALADNLITVQNDVLNALTSSWISPPSMELIH
jgi:sporulation protein YlmC with PRC-barrel domain